MRFNPYEGLEVIATCVVPRWPSLYCFNPYEGLEVIATVDAVGVKGDLFVSIPMRV